MKLANREVKKVILIVMCNHFTLFSNMIYLSHLCELTYDFWCRKYPSRQRSINSRYILLRKNLFWKSVRTWEKLNLSSCLLLGAIDLPCVILSIVFSSMNTITSKKFENLLKRKRKWRKYLQRNITFWSRFWNISDPHMLESVL